MITNIRMELFQALSSTHPHRVWRNDGDCEESHGVCSALLGWAALVIISTSSVTASWGCQGSRPGLSRLASRVSDHQTDYQGVNIYSNPSDFLTATQVSSPWQNSLNYLDYFPGSGHAALPTRKYYINSTNIYVRCSVDINIISIFRYIIHRDDILL